MRCDLATAAAVGQVSRDTIRKWVERGHINRYDDGDPDGPYETTEVLLWVDQRNPVNAVAGMLAAHERYQERWIA